MAKHKIALIPGDGIGKEVRAGGRARARSRRRAASTSSSSSPISTGRAIACCQDRQDDAGRRHGAAQGFREHLPGRRRLAGRARPRLAVGPADPDPPRLRRVREPAPVRLFEGVPCAARQPQAGRHRLLGGAREHRGRVQLGRRPHVPGHRERVRHPGGDLHPQGRRSRAEVRLRVRAHDQEEARDLGHQVERHHPHHAVLGRALRRDEQELSGHQGGPVPHRHPDGAFRAQSRTGSTSSSAPTCSATSCPTSARR